MKDLLMKDFVKSKKLFLIKQNTNKFYIRKLVYIILIR